MTPIELILETISWAKTELRDEGWLQYVDHFTFLIWLIPLLLIISLASNIWEGIRQDIEDGGQQLTAERFQEILGQHWDED